MLAHSLHHRRIVLVEGDRSIERAVAAALTRSFPDVEVVAARDADEALQLLADERSRMLIADVQAHTVDALELAKAARARWPSLPVIVIGSEPSEAQRTLVHALGGAAWLDHPPEVERLVGLVGRLLMVPAGFSGELAVDGLTELIQLLCAAEVTGALHIDHGAARGAIWFERGEIVDAESSGMRGAPTFHRMLRWTGGVFALDRNARASQRTIEVPTMQLLLEGVRLLDEESSRPPPPPTPPTRSDGRVERRSSEVRLRAIPVPGPSQPPKAKFPISAPPSVRPPVPPPRPAQVTRTTSRPPPVPAAATAAPAATTATSKAEVTDRWTTPQQKAAECFERGMNFARDKQYEQALREWESALALDPDNRTYQFNVRRLRELAARRQNARGRDGDQE